MKRLRTIVAGRVQGVTFRAYTRREAERLGLTGYALNRADGSVEVVAEGLRPACELLLGLLSEQPASGPPPDAAMSWYRRPGRVLEVAHAWTGARGGYAGFVER